MVATTFATSLNLVAIVLLELGEICSDFWTREVVSLIPPLFIDVYTLSTILPFGHCQGKEGKQRCVSVRSFKISCDYARFKRFWQLWLLTQNRRCNCNTANKKLPWFLFDLLYCTKVKCMQKFCVANTVLLFTLFMYQRPPYVLHTFQFISVLILQGGIRADTKWHYQTTLQ